MAQAGDVLSGRYELQELLGRGGMAEVFRARDLRLDRDVAVKILARHLLQDPAAERQLQREARATASLSHPGLVGVHDIGSDGDHQFIVLELVDGRTLSQILRDRGPLPVAEAVAVTAAAADAVQAAHARGVVHRDLKPSNVMVDRDGRVRVTDFGIAHAAAGPETATATAMLAGSVPYLSPEQAHGEQPTPAVDVYALGCLLFELLTGRPPFQRDTAAAVIAAHLHQEPPTPSSLRPEVSAGLDAVVARALAKDPSTRYRDAGALADALRGMAAGGGPVDRTLLLPGAATTRAIPVADGGPRGGPRRTWVPGAAAAAVAVAALAVWALGDSGDGFDPGGAASPAATTPATDEPTRASPSPRPRPSPSPSPSLAPDPEPPTPEEAAAEVRERLEEARRGFEIEDDDAEDLDDRLAEVVALYREGKDKDVEKKLRELRKRIDEYEREGKMSGDLASDLQAGLDALEESL